MVLEDLERRRELNFNEPEGLERGEVGVGERMLCWASGVDFGGHGRGGASDAKVM